MSVLTTWTLPFPLFLRFLAEARDPAVEFAGQTIAHLSTALHHSGRSLHHDFYGLFLFPKSKVNGAKSYRRSAVPRALVERAGQDSGVIARVQSNTSTRAAVRGSAVSRTKYSRSAFFGVTNFVLFGSSGLGSGTS